MQRLGLSDYLLTILFLLALSFGVYYGLQRWVLQVSVETTSRMQRAQRIFQ
jgi:hypothetical protein